MSSFVSIITNCSAQLGRPNPGMLIGQFGRQLEMMRLAFDCRRRIVRPRPADGDRTRNQGQRESSHLNCSLRKSGGTLTLFQPEREQTQVGDNHHGKRPVELAWLTRLEVKTEVRHEALERGAIRVTSSISRQIPRTGQPTLIDREGKQATDYQTQ